MEADRGRRGAIDVARVVALLVVVAGHLLLAVIDRGGPGGDVRGENLIALRPTWAWITAVAPMPVFFAAGGWANATSPLPAAARRLRSMVGLGAVVVGVWSAAVVITAAVAGDSDLVGDGARLATQPLWFLAAYAPFAAGGRWLAGVARRNPALAVGTCLAALAMLDVSRFGFGAPDWIGWPGFFLAWATPWLLGGWWRDRARAEGWKEKRAGFAFAAVGSVAAVALVNLGGYAVGLIDAVEGARSNTTPPTLYTAVAAIAQTGVLMVIAGALDRAARAWRGLWDRAGEAAVGVYLWHLTALALCTGAVALGLPSPDRLTALWWATRPAWWALVLAVTAGLVVATARIRRTPARLEDDASRSGTAAVGGVAITVLAAGLVGLEGPRSWPLAVVCSVLFAAAWASLRRAGSPATRPADR